MTDVNLVLLTGNVGADPEVKTQHNGELVATFPFATNMTDKNTEWSRIRAYGKNAETIAQYVKSGTALFISGRKHSYKLTDERGNIKYFTDIIINRFNFVGPKKQTDEPPANNNEFERPPF